MHVAEADGGEGGPELPELVLVLAQLRDLLTAEDSAVVPQENNYGWTFLAEADCTAAGFRHDKARELPAESFSPGSIVMHRF